MDGKDYHYNQIKTVLLKQKFVSPVIPVSTSLSKNSTSVAFLAGKICFTFSNGYRSQITLGFSWHRGN